jgi:hypothetical protein
MYACLWPVVCVILLCGCGDDRADSGEGVEARSSESGQAQFGKNALVTSVRQDIEKALPTGTSAAEVDAYFAQIGWVVYFDEEQQSFVVMGEHEEGDAKYVIGVVISATEHGRAVIAVTQVEVKEWSAPPGPTSRELEASIQRQVEQELGIGSTTEDIERYFKGRGWSVAYDKYTDRYQGVATARSGVSNGDGEERVCTVYIELDGNRRVQAVSVSEVRKDL